MRAKVQQFGGFVTQMIIPNIGAFIAWGLITTLFISVGWTPNEQLAKMVGPMLTYLLPILIGFSGGRLVHGFRGGVVGAAATMGVIVGADIPMLLAAMMMGPLAGWLMKKFDGAVEDRIPSGFEMLVNNFSAGILAAILAVIGNLLIGPIVQAISTALGAGVQALVDARLLPLVDILIEPGKVLFMNNAINHGVLGPLGAAQVQQIGHSLLFMLESNPGPGLGLLLAFWFAGKGMLKATAPSAIVIHFLGGIHEIYFPYVLAKPIMIVAMWAGGILADLWFVITGAGLVATPSPGSIIAYIAMTPNGYLLPVLGGVLIGAVASFLVGSFLLKAFPMKVEEEEAAAAASSAAVPAIA
jgi:PTS system mannitol-specific IIC component